MQISTTHTIFMTDWGHVVAVWSDKGLWEVSFPRQTVEEAMEDIMTPLGDTEETDELNAKADELRLQLNMYFRGFNEPFSVPIDWRCYSPFQEVVLRLTADIPYGKITTYGAMAKAAASPKAARAVGGALHRNRTPILVPCHRVVGRDGSLTGFGGGLEMKKALLMLEKNVASCSSNRL